MFTVSTKINIMCLLFKDYVVIEMGIELCII